MAAVIALDEAIYRREKRAATFRAVAAIQGWCSWPTVDDHGNPKWLLSKDHVTVELPLEAAEEFLAREREQRE